MENPAGAASQRVAYFFTRFPHPTETFLQREVRAMRRLGLEMRLYSWHGGALEFEGLPVRRFSKWSLLTLFWRAVLEFWRQPEEMTAFARRVFGSWPRDWLNYWENLYGIGIAAVMAQHFRRQPVAHIHAAWASLPAMVAWAVSRLTGIPFSTGAHAYDLFEYGGDWFLPEKCAAASFVHTSTDAGQARLIAMGLAPDRIVMSRRGLDRFPPVRELRRHRKPLRIVCVARLVEKKGLARQLEIYRACRDAGLDFSVCILGDGPLRAALSAGLRSAQLQDRVTLAGHVDQPQVWAELRTADILVHTGIVTASGDRDGLPNVVPEAMAAGAIVVTAPGGGVQEAIIHNATGIVCPLEDARPWLAAFLRVQRDDAFSAHLRTNARRWVEQNFDAGVNAQRLLDRFRAGPAGAPSATPSPRAPGAVLCA